jgi:hypothetical protein
MILTPHSHPRRRIYYQSKQMKIFQGGGKKENKKQQQQQQQHCIQNWFIASATCTTCFNLLQLQEFK